MKIVGKGKQHQVSPVGQISHAAVGFSSIFTAIRLRNGQFSSHGRPSSKCTFISIITIYQTYQSLQKRPQIELPLLKLLVYTALIKSSSFWGTQLKDIAFSTEQERSPSLRRPWRGGWRRSDWLEAHILYFEYPTDTWPRQHLSPALRSFALLWEAPAIRQAQVSSSIWWNESCCPYKSNKAAVIVNISLE